MRKFQVFYFLISFLFICSYCGKDSSLHDSITFINESNDTLYISWAFGYPDTLAYRYNPDPTHDPEFSRVLPNEKNRNVLFLYNSNWETYFNNHLPSDKLMIYVFEASVLENTPWETVINDYLVKERYDLTLQDLIDMDWVLTYPKQIKSSF